jgi:outer membrane protein assembly factor BamE (lipoprotein component of BamABCDE complex)
MRRPIVFLLALILPTALGAQSRTNSVSPGMTRARVVAALGAPSTERTVGEFKYLFYANACGKRCGMNDLVILRRDSVADAIFRSNTRHYTGTSSSPMAISEKDAAERGAAKPSPAGSKSGTTRMTPPLTPNDARPSIPTNQPTLSPSPSKTPATRTP